MTSTYRLKVAAAGWPVGTIVTKCKRDPTPIPGLTLVESSTPGHYRNGSNGLNSQPDGMFGAWVRDDELEEIKVQKAIIICEGGSRLCPPHGTEVFVKPSSFGKHDSFLWFSLDGVTWLDEILADRFKIIDDSPEVDEQTSQVLPASSVPPVTVKRKVLTIDNIGVGQTFIVHGKPEEVYVKISNSHVFNHKLLQMHTTDAQRFQSHLNLVVVELHVFNGK